MKTVCLIKEATGSKRVALGVSYLEKSLKKAGYEIVFRTEQEVLADYRSLPGQKIYAGVRGQSAFLKELEQQELLLYHCAEPEGEGFYLSTVAGGLTVVAGGSDTGTLYGCLELAERI